MKDLDAKRQKEKDIVAFMIALYCKKNHHTKCTLCPECAELSRYAQERSDRCPFMETKTFCANCHVHCYKPEMQEKIRTVMRFSGPRMLLYRPKDALWHLITSKIEKHRQNKVQ